MSQPYHRVVYNPNLDQIGEMIPLYARYEVNDLGKMEGYSVSLSNDRPMAYVIFSDNIGNGVILNAVFVQKKIKDGTIVFIDEEEKNG
jgi:hypothetical protein